MNRPFLWCLPNLKRVCTIPPFSMWNFLCLSPWRKIYNNLLYACSLQQIFSFRLKKSERDKALESGSTDPRFKKILGSSPTHLEFPQWEWVTHITPSSYLTNRLRVIKCPGKKCEIISRGPGVVIPWLGLSTDMIQCPWPFGSGFRPFTHSGQSKTGVSAWGVRKRFGGYCR